VFHELDSTLAELLERELPASLVEQATSLRDDWSEETKRSFISNVVPLYKKRGTRDGIEKVLRLSGDEAKVVDFNDGQDVLTVARFSTGGQRLVVYLGDMKNLGSYFYITSAGLYGKQG
jgi:hypothetical protein